MYPHTQLWTYKAYVIYMILFHYTLLILLIITLYHLLHYVRFRTPLPSLQKEGTCGRQEESAFDPNSSEWHQASTDCLQEVVNTNQDLKLYERYTHPFRTPASHIPHYTTSPKNRLRRHLLWRGYHLSHSILWFYV